MTRKVTLLLASFALSLPTAVLASDGSKPEPDAAATQGEASSASGDDDVKSESFGAPLSAGKFLQLSEVLASPARFAGEAVRVEGQVRSACSRKGCWMELSADEGEGPGCRVTFKDYGFFVPKDAAGASARIEGTVEVKTVPAAQVAHLEAEGARFAKEADGTAKEIRIVATGVELTR